MPIVRLMTSSWTSERLLRKHAAGNEHKATEPSNKMAMASCHLQRNYVTGFIFSILSC